MSSIAFIIKKNDINIFYLFNKKLRCKSLDLLMKTVTELGSTVFAVLLSSIFFLYGVISKNLEPSFTLILNHIISQLIVHIVKRMVNRPRPCKTLDWATPVKVPACKYSFPSGHTCAAFSIALVISSLLPSLKFIFISIAILVAISRIYLGCHYPTDVLIGFLIALFSFSII